MSRDVSKKGRPLGGPPKPGAFGIYPTLSVHHKPFSANLYVSLAYLQVSTRRPSLSVKEQPGSPPPPKDIRVRTPHMTKHKGIDDTGGGAVATIWPPEVACLAGVCAVATDTTAALNPLLL